MSIEITSNGNTLGYADDASVRYGTRHHNGASPFSAGLKRSLSIDLEGFSEADPDRVDYKALCEARKYHYDSLFEELIELREAYNRRGKTIEELTDTFKAKKERIHAFYAPQLENRRQELEDHELMKKFAHNETLSANKWYLRADELEEQLEQERRRRSNQYDTIRQYQNATGTMTPLEVGQQAGKPAIEQSVHDSVIQEYEEHIGDLARQVIDLRESYRVADDARASLAATNSELRAELHVAKRTIGELEERADKFVEAHRNASFTINNAVIAWEDSK